MSTYTPNMVLSTREYDAVGKRPIRHDGHDKVTGKARYGADIGLPGVIKTARLGYDGKGQVTVRDMADLESAWASLKTDDAVYEKLVNLKSEISVIVARDLSGHTVAYPPGENVPLPRTTR